MVIATRQPQPSLAGGFEKAGVFPKFAGFGRPDLSQIEDLVALGQAQGGEIQERVEEIVHPERSILATMSNGFKEAFASFVDTISIPSRAIAGILSPDLTIREAIAQRKNPSDVLLGLPDPDETAMQKVGSFATRFAVDVLLDPLTYVSFGAVKGILGVTSRVKIPAGQRLAGILKKKPLDLAALSDEGEELYLKRLEMQRRGLASSARKTIEARVGKNWDEFTSLEKEQSERMIKDILDSELDPEYVKRSISALIERNPDLANTILDKGGIKFFGKTILSGQKISSAISLIPGVNLIDKTLEPSRRLLSSLFNKNADVEFGKLPDEVSNILQKYEDLQKSKQIKSIKDVADAWRELKITAEEDNFLRASIEAGKRPSDSRLAAAWNIAKGINKDTLKAMRDAGMPITEVPNYMSHFLVEEKLTSIPFTLPPRTAIKQAKEAKIAKFVDIWTGRPLIGSPEVLKLKEITEEVPSALEKGERLFADVEGEVLKRTRATVEDAKSIGVQFEESALNILVKSQLNVNRGVLARELLREIGEKAGALASEAPTGWRPIGVSALKEKSPEFVDFLSGTKAEALYFHPAVAKRLENFFGSMINDEPTQKLLKHFDSLQNLWKASVTSVFPQFHGRNAISNVFLHFADIGLHSFNPANHIMSAKLIQDDVQASKLAIKAAGGDTKAIEQYTDMLSKVILRDKSGYEWTFGELRQLLRDRNVAFNYNQVGALDVQLTSKEMWDKLVPSALRGGDKTKFYIKKSLPFTQEFGLFSAGRRVGTAIEEQARILDFLVNLRNTGDPILAAQRTKQFLFDYQNLTGFEREFLRRIMPFYTFTRKNLELQTRVLFSTPGRTATQIHGLTTIGDVLGGGGLTEEERNALPEWMRDGISILKGRRGSTVEVFKSFGSPLEQPFEAFQPNILLGSISPVLRVPLEEASGYHFFADKPLQDVTNAAAFKSAPSALKDFIGFTELNGTKSDGSPFTWYVSLRPERMHLVLNLPPFSRVLSSLKQMQAVDVSSGSKILQQLVGVRPFAFDIEREAAKREKELRTKLEDVLTSAGVTAKLRRVFIPKE